VNSLPTQYPDLATVVKVGKSYEGRDLITIKITSTENNKKFNESGKAKPVVWADFGIHAREWISPATGIWMANQILVDYQQGSSFVRRLVDNAELYFLFVFNPDGYSYTWTNDRLWRKTRSKNAGTVCVGTDPNRNFDYQWGGAGTSGDPCSEIYRGNGPNSEIEIKSVTEYLATLNLQGYISFHSYSQLWMTPWAYTLDFPKDYGVQNELSRKCVKALQDVNGIQYKFGTVSRTIYEASGSAIDWTYGRLGVLYSATPELRDLGRYGFLLPADQIIPSGKETYEALLVFAQTAVFPTNFNQ